MGSLFSKKTGIVLLAAVLLLGGLIALLSYQMKQQFYNSLRSGVETEAEITLPKGAKAETYETESDFFFSSGMTYAVFAIDEKERAAFSAQLEQRGWASYTPADYHSLFDTSYGEIASAYLPADSLGEGLFLYKGGTGEAFTLFFYAEGEGRLYCCMNGE